MAAMGGGTATGTSNGTCPSSDGAVEATVEAENFRPEKPVPELYLLPLELLPVDLLLKEELSGDFVAADSRNDSGEATRRGVVAYPTAGTSSL